MSTAKLADENVYQQDDNDDPMEEQENDNYHVQIGQEEIDEEPALDERELNRKFNDLLFCVQGVGSYKNINGLDVYVKHEHCLESLKDIYKHLKVDSTSYPFIRKTLGDWNFFEKDLIPLAIFHK